MKKLKKTEPKPEEKNLLTPKKKKTKTDSPTLKQKKEVTSKPIKKTKTEPEKTVQKVRRKSPVLKSVLSDLQAAADAVLTPTPTIPQTPEPIPQPEKISLPIEETKPPVPVVSSPEIVPVTVPTPPVEPVTPKQTISINETITVKDLATKMNLKVTDLLMKLLKMGIRASLNQRLEIDTATLIASEFGFDAEFVPLYSEEAMLSTNEDTAIDLVPRPAIVTVMGHVDHGKTSLLDAIREANVAEKEAGGITQHIGAYKVHIEKGDIVFLDTPGHEAFTAMRARGTQITDLVILVVAADDGVKPQTIEAIDHARAGNVPVLVAINKIDLPGSKPERVKQELSNHGLTPEDWGGKTIFVEVSAKKRVNIDKLLEMILLESELLELKANPNRSAQGVVIEAKLDPQKGPVATVIIQKGTLKIGNTFVCGLTSGKVKALMDDRRRRILEAGPSTPVEVLGFSETSQLGDRIIVVQSDREAREIIEKRKNLSRESHLEKKRHLSLESLSTIAKEGKIKELNLIVKADVQGSLEALKDSMERIESPEIRIKVIHSGVGGITESDISLAAASDAIVIGFSVRPESAAEDLARQEGVEVKTYRIIYEAINEIRASLSGMLEPEEKEVILGKIEIREVFKTPSGKVAGCMVLQGKVNRSCRVRLLRDSKIIYEGTISSLRRFKEDTKEVEQGFECGISFENFQDFDRKDLMEAFTKEKLARKLE